MKDRLQKFRSGSTVQQFSLLNHQAAGKAENSWSRCRNFKFFSWGFLWALILIELLKIKGQKKSSSETRVNMQIIKKKKVIYLLKSFQSRGVQNKVAFEDNLHFEMTKSNLITGKLSKVQTHWKFILINSTGTKLLKLSFLCPKES